MIRWPPIVRAWRILMFFGLPLILLPFPLVIGSRFAGVIYVLVVTITLLLSQTIPQCMAALVPIVLYPLLGVHSASTVAMWSINDAMLLLTGSMIMGIAVESAKLHIRMSLKVLLILGPKPERILLAIMGISYFFSMWIADITVVVMLMPMVRAIQKELETLHDDTVAVSIISSGSGGEVKSQAKKSNKANSVESGLALALMYGSTFGGIATPVGSYPTIILKLTVDRLYGDAAQYDFAAHMALFVPLGLASLVVTWIVMTFRYAPGFVSQLWKKREVDHEMVKRQDQLVKSLRVQYDNLGSMSFREKSTSVFFGILVALWLFRDPPSFPGWIVLFPERYVSSGTISMLFAIIFFIWPSDISLIWSEGKNEPLVKWRPDMTERFPWQLIFFAMGMNVLGRGTDVAELSEVVTSAVHPISSLDPFLFLIILVVVITTITELFSTSIILFVLLPILAKYAEQQHVNPLYYMIPTAMAAMLSFMLPVVSNNAVYIYGTGAVTIKHMWRIGWIPKIATTVLIVLCVYALGDAVLDLHTFPAWAANRTHTI